MCTLRMDRADKANALTAAMLAELHEAVLGAYHAKVLVITGTGKVFSAGMDLDAAKTNLPTSPIWEDLSNAIARHPGLTIAALNGTAAGGSLGMVLACDLRIAVDRAKLFYPVMRLGFLPQPSDPARLAALIGAARAKRILMVGEKVTAETAYAWGLFDYLITDDALHSTIAEVAADALGASSAHVTGIKRLIP